MEPQDQQISLFRNSVNKDFQYFMYYTIPHPTVTEHASSQFKLFTWMYVYFLLHQSARQGFTFMQNAGTHAHLNRFYLL